MNQDKTTRLELHLNTLLKGTDAELSDLKTMHLNQLAGAGLSKEQAEFSRSMIAGLNSVMTMLFEGIDQAHDYF